MLPYQERVVQEKLELDDRILRLTEFTLSHNFEGVNMYEQQRLTKQLRIMQEYSNVLNERIGEFKNG
jgi:hypothetical protein